MKQVAFAILLVVAVVAGVLLALNRPGAEATPDITITVDSSGDTVIKDDDVLTLREAMLLATGGRLLSELSKDECGQVSGASWEFPFGPCEADKYSPGAVSADTIVFDTAVFYPGGATVITLGSTLPTLNTGDDTVDGSAVGLTVWGSGTDEFHCFEITSDSNTIKGLEIRNCRSGVIIHADAQDNTVGGSTEAERNVISGNDIGVFIGGDGTNGNVVKGNFIGTDTAGGAAVPNRVGVGIEEAQDNSVGGSNEAESNVISGNGTGVLILDDGADYNRVTGNYIGTTASGTAALPNGHGVYISNGAQNNTIGGTAAGEGNTIAFSNQVGVWVDGAATTGNAIRGNSIHSNGLEGIYLVGGGNTELAPPTITGFGSVVGTACPNCIIDIYSDDEDEGGGYEGWTTAGGDGNWSFLGWPEGPNATATATDSDGNTSEFSAPVAVPEPPPTPTPSPGPSPSPTATATPTPTPETTRTVVWGPGWQNATWSGASTPEEAFACAAGNYAAAYRLVSGGWERYFPDQPGISNMTDLEQYDSFLILVAGDVTCEMSVVDPSGTERTLDWGIGWNNDGWTGADGTTPQDAFACADGSYTAAYRLVGGSWERYFPDQPGISNMGPLDRYDAFLIQITAPVSCVMPIAP
jgi:parallel beta-helix repeat protein